MPGYELTLDAEQDPLEIASYTITTWGLEQAARYEAAIVGCLENIGQREARTATPLPHRPELRVSRCEHYFVFILAEEAKRPLILAVFHEKMELMARLRERAQE